MKIINERPMSVENQKKLIERAAKNGVKKYSKRISDLVGDYDKDWVTNILSNENADWMWDAYCEADTMVRDYVIEVINWK